LNNYWLSGFSDALGSQASFQINLKLGSLGSEELKESLGSLESLDPRGFKELKGSFGSLESLDPRGFKGLKGFLDPRWNKIEVRLNFKINQKNDNLLILIKNFLGGNLGYIKSQNTFYYESTNLGSAKKVINYFDHFHLLSSKHINYLKWRKIYIIIQNLGSNGILLGSKDLEKIIKLKKTMNRCSS
jgi:hypothetical protein